MPWVKPPTGFVKSVARRSVTGFSTGEPMLPP
jgi:hypothetical protein